MGYVVAVGVGAGWGLLIWLGFYPEPGGIRTPIFGLAAILWAMGGLWIFDHLPNRKEKDFKW